MLAKGGPRVCHLPETRKASLSIYAVRAAGRGILRRMPPYPPVALSVAGSDCSSGAGLQADLKTFTAHQVYGLTAATCVVAEVPRRVVAIQAIEPGVVRRQMELLLAAFPVAAMKTGMLFSREVIETVASFGRALPPLVVDPVMVASSGDLLLQAGATAAYRERLFPLAALVTPNLDEARVLLGGQSIPDVPAMRAAGAELVSTYGVPFLMKGGHLGGEEAVDLLCEPGGAVTEYRAPFVRGVSTHGTGCTYSAAITAGLARGFPLPAAVARAKKFISAAIGEAFHWECDGRRVDALNHWPSATT